MVAILDGMDPIEWFTTIQARDTTRRRLDLACWFREKRDRFPSPYSFNVETFRILLDQCIQPFTRRHRKKIWFSNESVRCHIIRKCWYYNCSIPLCKEHQAWRNHSGSFTYVLYLRILYWLIRQGVLKAACFDTQREMTKVDQLIIKTIIGLSLPMKIYIRGLNIWPCKWIRRLNTYPKKPNQPAKRNWRLVGIC